MKKKSGKKTTPIKKKSSPAIDSMSPGEFQEILDRLAHSPRYMMFEGLQVAALVSKKQELTKSLSDLTLAQAIELGAAALARRTDITGKHFAAVGNVLKGLLADDPSTPPAPSGKLLHLPPHRIAKSRKPSLVSSVEAEQQLTAAIGKLATHPKLSELSTHTLGEFWQEEWPRAPFEEAFTFAQFASMKPQAILEKRSFTAQKLACVLRAVEIGLGTIDTVKQQALPKTTSAKPVIRAIHSAGTSGSWEAQMDAAPFIAAALASQLLKELDAISDPHTEFARVLLRIPDSLTPQEFSCVVLANQHGGLGAHSVLEIDETEFQSMHRQAQAKIIDLVKECAPVLFSTWQIGLTKTACTVEELFKPHLINQIDTTLQNAIAHTIAAALAASGS